eukprot:scaffold6657_cov161-Skeletonema_marinoi.AAC.1
MGIPFGKRQKLRKLNRCLNTMCLRIEVIVVLDNGLKDTSKFAYTLYTRVNMMGEGKQESWLADI